MSYSRTGSGSSTTSLLRKASFYGSEDRVIIEIVSFIPSCNLALMVFAQPNGLIIDIGFNETIVIPVIPNAGKHITQRLKTLLIHAKIVADITDSGISTTTEFLDTLSDWDIEKIKVQIALAALTVPNIQPDSSHYTLIKDVYFRINSKSMLKIPGWIREACVETLFEKTIEDISIQSAILNCLVKCPIDIRNEMVQNSVLIGGSSMIPGLGPRLQYQLMSDSDKIPKYQILNRLSPRIKFLKSIFQPNLICYVGASLLGSAKLSVHGEVKAANYTEQSIIPDWTINVDSVEQ
ncbi:Actin- protein 10 [Globomyces sp. JEL0801]|nr:Actin- protein 10 [Globomyces sp. JEL0801]